MGTWRRNLGEVGRRKHVLGSGDHDTWEGGEGATLGGARMVAMGAREGW